MLRYQMLDAEPSFQDSLRALEADIQRANALAASIPKGKGKDCLQMKLVYNKLAPFLCLFRWMDCACSFLLSTHLDLFHVIVYKVSSNEQHNIHSYGRKATIKEFYSVILPSLQRLQDNSVDADIAEEKGHSIQMVINSSTEDKRKKPSDLDLERENECGICLEPCTKMVLPNCCHAMCINCYSEWNSRSESCPFCRESLKRVNSGDLWVLTCSSDVIDVRTIYTEDVLRLYLFVNNLPEYIPDALFFMYSEYLS